MARVIAVANQKGGVGKTTTTVNLGAVLAGLSRRTLIIDLDPQGHTTVGLGVDLSPGSPSVYQVLTEDLPVGEARVAGECSAGRCSADLVPAGIDLAYAEVKLGSVPGKEVRLAKALQAVASDYEFCLIDCPPSLNLLTANALTAADAVLVPVQPQFYSYVGFAQLTETVRTVRKYLNEKLTVEGVLVTQVDGRSKYHREVIGHLREDLADYRLFRTTIPQSIQAQKASQAGVPVVRYDPGSPAAQAYHRLAEELLRG